MPRGRPRKVRKPIDLIQSEFDDGPVDWRGEGVMSTPEEDQYANEIWRERGPVALKYTLQAIYVRRGDDE